MQSFIIISSVCHFGARTLSLIDFKLRFHWLNYQAFGDADHYLDLKQIQSSITSIPIEVGFNYFLAILFIMNHVLFD